MNVQLTRRAEKDLERLSPERSLELLRKLQHLDFSPTSPHVKKIGRARRKGLYRARVGDYRILYIIEGDTAVLLRIVRRRDLDTAIRQLLGK